MDGHLARRIVEGAWAGPDAGHLAGDHGHRVRFRELGRGFPWAWDEEVAADEARLQGRQSARLAAACPVGADALAEEVLRRDAPRAVGPGGASWDALDATVVVAQDAARQVQRVLQAQMGVPPLAPVLPRELGLRVSPRGRQGPELQRELVLQAQASPPQVREHVQPAEQLKAQGQQASRPLADVPALPGEQPEPLAAPDVARLPSLRLLSRPARLPRRFRHSRHLAGDA